MGNKHKPDWLVSTWRPTKGEPLWDRCVATSFKQSGTGNGSVFNELGGRGNFAPWDSNPMKWRASRKASSLEQELSNIYICVCIYMYATIMQPFTHSNGQHNLIYSDTVEELSGGHDGFPIGGFKVFCAIPKTVKSLPSTPFLVLIIGTHEIIGW